MEEILSNDYLKDFLGEFENREWPLIIQSLSIYGLYSLSKVIPIGKYKSEELYKYVKENISIPKEPESNLILKEINKLKNRISSLDYRIRNIPPSPSNKNTINNNVKSIHELRESAEKQYNHPAIIQHKGNNIRGESAPPQRMRFNKEENEIPILAVRQTSWRKGNNENFDQVRRKIGEKMPSTPIHKLTINSYIYPSWWNDPLVENNHYIMKNKSKNKGKEETRIINEKEANSEKKSQIKQENQIESKQIMKQREPIKMIFDNNEFKKDIKNINPILFEGKQNHSNMSSSQQYEDSKEKSVIHKVMNNPKEYELRIKSADNFKPYYLRNVILN